MTYTHGESAQYKLHDRLQAARERAAIIELQMLEAQNQAAQARLDDYLATRAREAGRYPVDPNWREHVATLAREVRAHDRAVKARNTAQACTKATSTALQDVAGIIAPRNNPSPAERHTALRAVS